MGNSLSLFSKPEGVWPRSNSYDYRWPAGPSRGDDVLFLRRSILKNRLEPSSYTSLAELIERNESAKALEEVSASKADVYQAKNYYFHRLMQVPTIYRPSDSMLVDAVLQMGLMPAAVMLPRLSTSLKTSENDLRLKRTISTFQSVIREKEEEIFMLERKMSLSEQATQLRATRSSAPKSEDGETMEKQEFTSTMTKLINTLYSSDNKPPDEKKHEVIDSLEKMRLCLRKIRVMNDEDWQKVLEPIGDTLIKLHNEQHRPEGAALSSQQDNDRDWPTLDRILAGSLSDTASNAGASEADRPTSAFQTVEEAEVQEERLLQRVAQAEQQIQSERMPTLETSRSAASQSGPVQKVKTDQQALTEVDLRLLADRLDDEQLSRLLTLRSAANHRQRLEDTQTLADSGVVTPFSATLNQTQATDYEMLENSLLSPRSVLHVEINEQNVQELCNALQLVVDSALIDMENRYKERHGSVLSAPNSSDWSLSNEQAVRFSVSLQNGHKLGVADVIHLMRSLRAKAPGDLRLHVTEQVRQSVDEVDVNVAFAFHEQLRREALLLQLTVLHFAEPTCSSFSAAPLTNQLEYLRAAWSSTIGVDELNLLVRDLFLLALKSLGGVSAADSIDLFARVLIQCSKLLDQVNKSHLQTAERHVSNGVTTQTEPRVKVEAHIQTLLDTRSQQSSRIRELEELIETYRLTATNLNSSMSRDIAALSSIANDLRGVTPRPSATFRQPIMEENAMRDSCASLQIESYRAETSNSASVSDGTGEMRNREKYDVQINVQLDAGKNEARVKLIECERIIDEMQKKVAIFSEDLQRRNEEVSVKSRENDQLRGKVENLLQIEATLKQQISVLSNTIATLSQNGSPLEQLSATSRSDLADLEAERHRLYEASRSDSATIHKLQVTIREMELVNRKLKSQLDLIQSSHGSLVREINALKGTIDDLTMQLDSARLQCAAWQRKASNYRHIAANIMSKLSSYKKQIRSLVLAHSTAGESARTSFDAQSLRNSISIFEEDYHTETFNLLTDHA